MSEGKRCVCVNAIHEGARRPSTHSLALAEAGLCSAYAADVEIGGLCSSCASGWHEPCSRQGLHAQLPGPEPYGICGRCGWHSSEHR